jgi:hypothetical protein
MPQVVILLPLDRLETNIFSVAPSGCDKGIRKGVLIPRFIAAAAAAAEAEAIATDGPGEGVTNVAGLLVN